MNHLYTRVGVNGKVVFLHRLVWERAHGEIPRGFDIHHKNGDRHDNRIENLEMLSHAEHARQHLAGRSKVTRSFDCVCKVCGVAFQAKQRRAAYCSNACYLRFHRSEHAEQSRERDRAYYAANIEKCRAVARNKARLRYQRQRELKRA